MTTSVQTLADTPVTNKPHRRKGVCATCQTHQLVRKDGLVAKHRNWRTEKPCKGADTTPIPLDVPDWADFPDNAGKVLDRWDYLSLPLRHLKLMLGAYCEEDVPAPYVGYQGEIRSCAEGSPWKWVIFMPIGQPAAEHDLSVRWMLASAHGIDVTDWPLPLADRPLGGTR